MTADTLAFIIHVLSLPDHVLWQRALQKELVELNISSDHEQPLRPQELSAIGSAPILDAVIKETMRAYPPSSISKQRTVPRHGHRLDGYFIPGGTIVGAPVPLVNWDPALFDRQDRYPVRKWLPQRWLDATPKQFINMDKNLFSFGNGARQCLGKK